MTVSALGLVSPLSQGPAASKKFKDILPLLLGKYKPTGFYSPWGELPKSQACAWIPAVSSPKEAIEGPALGRTQESGRPGCTEHSLHERTPCAHSPTTQG